MLLTSSDTKRTLVHLFRPESTGFNMYAEYTQLQLTFLALQPWIYPQNLPVQMDIPTLDISIEPASTDGYPWYAFSSLVTSLNTLIIRDQLMLFAVTLELQVKSVNSIWNIWYIFLLASAVKISPSLSRNVKAINYRSLIDMLGAQPPLGQLNLQFSGGQRAPPLRKKEKI